MSSEHSDTFSPKNLSVLGGLLLIALFLGEVVFPRHADEGMSAGDSKGPGTMEDIALRLKPVVTLDNFLATASSGSGELAAMSPKQLYEGACMACHAAGIAGAPRLGDSAAWQVRLASGIDSLVATVVNGKGAMPPNGGSAYSGDQIRSVIGYMLGESGV